MTTIFLIVGGPAVGKSTTSRALAACFEKSVHLDVDQLRNMVVSGLALPSSDWGDELVSQIALARHAAVHMAVSYQRAGYTVVIDDFWDRNGLAEYRGLAPGTVRVVLLPDQREAHRRNLLRSGDTPARDFIDAGIADTFGRLVPLAEELVQEGWLLVDSTELSPEAVVAAILTSNSND